jgi:hypothetical protein
MDFLTRSDGRLRSGDGMSSKSNGSASALCDEQFLTRARAFRTMLGSASAPHARKLGTTVGFENHTSVGDIDRHGTGK